MLRRVAIVGALAGLILALGVNAATADTTYQSWTQQIATASKTTSTATATWSPSDPSVTLDLTTGVLATGKCVTVYFDWTSTGHHDARALRDCKGNDTVEMVYTEPTPTNITGGPKKLGVCYGLDDARGACLYAAAPGAIYMDWTPWPDPLRASACDVSWTKRSADGTTTQFIDPHPPRPTMVSPGVC